MELRYKLVHTIVMTQRIEPLFNKVTFMIPMLSLFDALTGGLVSFNNAMCVVFSVRLS